MKREAVFILVQTVLLLISVILTDGFINSNEVVMRVGDPAIVYDMTIKENDRHAFQFQFNGKRIEILHHGIKDPTNTDSGIGKKEIITIMLLVTVLAIGIFSFLNENQQNINTVNKILFIVAVLQTFYVVYLLIPPSTTSKEVLIIHARETFLTTFFKGPINREIYLKEGEPIKISISSYNGSGLSLTINEDKSVSGGSQDEPPPVGENICVGIFNLSAFPDAGNRIGMLRRKKFRIKFENRERFFLSKKEREYANTVIYYEDAGYRDLALQIADYLPGEQSVGEITTTIQRTLRKQNFTKFKNIVILLGNDIEEFSTLSP